MNSPDLPIQFPCHCGYRFRVAADRAGSVIQCPQCGLLTDIPTLSDLDSLSDDGTLLLKPAAIKPEINRVAVVDRHFGPSRTDRSGNEIDLRNTHDDLANIGAAPESDQIPVEGDDVQPSKPKYDPVTGELIRPMQLARRPDIEEEKNVPLAKRALNYAAGDTAHIMSARRIFVQLFMPVNVVVMFFIFLFYFIFQLLGMFMGGVLSLAGVMPTLYNLPLAMLLMAHYVNTLEDNGPDSMDELPRPMRNLSFADDFWRPFSNMAIAIAYCFLPAGFCFLALPGRFKVLTIFPAGLGLLFFPAALLTATAAGSLVNLRPDRLAGIVRAARGQYTLSFILWLFSLPLFIYSLFGIYLVPQELRDDHQWIYNFNRPSIAYPLLFITIILLHFASWHLGLIYRRHHDQFSWVLQRHVSVRRQQEAQKAAEILAQHRKQRYVK